MFGLIQDIVKGLSKNTAPNLCLTSKRAEIGNLTFVARFGFRLGG